MFAYIDKHYRTTPEVIAAKLAELQHAPGVTPYLTNVYRDTCTSSRGRLVLTDGAKADIIAAAETL